MASMFSPSDMSNGTFTFFSTCASLTVTLSYIASTLISTCVSLARTLSNIVPTLISTCASLAGTLVLLRSIVGEVIADQLSPYFRSFFYYLFARSSSKLTLVINESSDISDNEVYYAAHLYLPTKIGPKTKRFGLSKTARQQNFEISIEKDEEIEDIFERIPLKWRYKCTEPREKNPREKKFFELSFDKQFTGKVIDFYLPHVLAKAKEMKENSKVVRIYNHDRKGARRGWCSMILEHPATFVTVAMDPELKEMIIQDLDRFRRRREFYKKVGKSWKRGYLLYGPPGTGKSSLIAAMANHLKFDIYDLELASIYSNLELRDVLASTTNRSIIVIEDIDCSVQPQDTENQRDPDNRRPRFTLSGILNFIDGLWSSCGDERIIVFTTNHKDCLDPALLRPGRMDMHIELSYCTVNVIRTLASNYLNISIGDHTLFEEIESLIQSTKVTPAEVTEELMRKDGADLALEGLVNFLKHKGSKRDKIEEEDAGMEEANSLKSDNEKGGQDNTKTATKGSDQGLID